MEECPIHFLSIPFACSFYCSCAHPHPRSVTHWLHPAPALAYLYVAICQVLPSRYEVSRCLHFLSAFPCHFSVIRLEKYNAAGMCILLAWRRPKGWQSRRGCCQRSVGHYLGPYLLACEALDTREWLPLTHFS